MTQLVRSGESVYSRMMCMANITVSLPSQIFVDQEVDFLHTIVCKVHNLLKDILRHGFNFRSMSQAIVWQA